MRITYGFVIFDRRFVLLLHRVLYLIKDAGCCMCAESFQEPVRFGSLAGRSYAISSMDLKSTGGSASTPTWRAIWYGTSTSGRTTTSVRRLAVVYLLRLRFLAVGVCVLIIAINLLAVQQCTA